MSSLDLTLLVNAVREAGELALGFLAKGFKSWNKPDGSLVTEADLAVDAFLKSKLLLARPDYGWVSEESPDDLSRLSAPKTWIVDPIDGTRNFAKTGVHWCIGASLVQDGKPLLACVFHPQLTRVYTAQLGHGCFLNAERLHIADGFNSIAKARVMGTNSLTSILTRHGAKHVPANDTPLLARLAMIASDELDVVVSTGPKYDWDLASGALLVTEAGGVVTDLQGNAHRYNQLSRQQSGLVASSPKRHKRTVELLEPL